MTTLPTDDLAPDFRRFQQTLAAAYAAHPPLDSVSLDAARAITEQVRAPLARGGPAMVQREDHRLPGGLHVRVLRPSDAPLLPALVYLHGGGWVFFSLETHDRLMRELAARSGRVVIGVDYSRAPEARFPVALDETLAAWRWVRDSAASLGVDPARIALGGDSAGANLALSAALDLRAEGARPDALLLLYGAFSDDDSGESFTRFDGPAYTLGRDEMRGFWSQYLRDERDRADPRAMPLKAALGDLRGLPRCALVVPECDVLRDGSLALAARLQAAGVPVSLQRHAGATHSFLEAVSFSPLADRALAQCSGWLRGNPA
jgi:acetyl esterase